MDSILDSAQSAAGRQDGDQSVPGRDDNPEFEAGIGRYRRAAITPEVRRLSVVNGWRARR